MVLCGIQHPLPFPRGTPKTMVSLGLNFTLLFTLLILLNLVSDSSCDLLGCDSVKFYLVNRNTTGNSQNCLNQTEPLFGGRFNASKPTKIVVHGWKNYEPFTTKITESYLNSSDVNVIQVDWTEEAGKNYFSARAKVSQVARTVAVFVQRLVNEFELKLADVHLVGFSLGAHVVGLAGYHFKVPNQIARVTGLDPAGPLFWGMGPDGMISEESGAFVVIVHTSMGLLGTAAQCGHVDFYPNDGKPAQPGCEFKEDAMEGCSHYRAVELYCASLRNPFLIKGTRCNSYEEFIRGTCRNSHTVYLNGDVDVKARGSYYFKTTAIHPYAA